MEPRRIERTVTIFASPEDAEAETRRAYRQLSGNERVAITVELQRRYYQQRGGSQRLQRILTVIERP